MQNKPSWYTNDHDSAWERVKGAFRRDWEQTKHDFGSDRARDLDQDAGDTVRQATTGVDSARETSFEDHEPAFRFGHAARRNYGTQYSSWNDDLDSRLRQDYGSDYERHRNSIRRAYEYNYPTGSSTDTGTDARTQR